MPIYEYQCKKCGHRFELLRRLGAADDETKCPKCRSKAVERLLSSFAAGKCGSSHSGSG